VVEQCRREREISRLSVAAPAARTESPRGRAAGISQEGRPPVVTLYDFHRHVEGTISPEQATKLEATGVVRLVRSQGTILRAYRATMPGENFEEWRPRLSGGFVVLQTRRIVRAGR
jgi:hypothetical protein